MKEIWKDVKNYKGIYMVSNLGRVKSLAKEWHSGNLNNCKRSHPDIILKTVIHRGYKAVTLCNKNKKTKKIHRLVAEAFIPNPLNKPQINHIDCNKLNNKETNLEFSTSKENIQHAYKNGLCKILKGAKVGGSKLTEKKIIVIKKLLKKGIYQKDIAKIFNVHQVTICYINKNKTWKHVEVA